MKKLLLSFSIALLLNSCVALKSYERQYVNDDEMQMGNDAGQNFVTYSQSIREGATPTNGKKGSGGCGCN